MGLPAAALLSCWLDPLGLLLWSNRAYFALAPQHQFIIFLHLQADKTQTNTAPSVVTREVLQRSSSSPEILKMTSFHSVYHLFSLSSSSQPLLFQIHKRILGKPTP